MSSQKSLPASLFQREEIYISPPLKKGDKGGFLKLPGNFRKLFSGFNRDPFSSMN
jgi:hypothetical protein